MSVENIVAVIGAIAALLAAGFVVKFVISKKSTSTVQKGNKLSGGSQMAGRDINK